MISVLLLDDDDNVRQAVQRVLTAENFRVVPAANRLEALERCQASRIDVVLLDLNLGKENGWETLRMLRELQPGLTFIVITANSEQRAAGSKHQIEAFMEKPFDVPVLISKLNELATANGKPTRMNRAIQGLAA